MASPQLRGGNVKRLASFVLFLCFGLILTAPAVAHASPGSHVTPSQKQAQKEWKKYNQQQAKLQKKQMNAEKKKMKQWKKQHGNTVTTVT
jgi:hypothetical protein